MKCLNFVSQVVGFSSPRRPNYLVYVFAVSRRIILSSGDVHIINNNVSLRRNPTANFQVQYPVSPPHLFPPTSPPPHPSLPKPPLFSGGSALFLESWGQGALGIPSAWPYPPWKLGFSLPPSWWAANSSSPGFFPFFSSPGEGW